MSALRRLGLRLIGIADDPADDDGVRLRKRIGVAAGYITILAPATLPIQAQGHPLSWPLAAALSLASAANLLLLPPWVWLFGLGWLGTYVLYPVWSLVFGRRLTSI